MLGPSPSPAVGRTIFPDAAGRERGDGKERAADAAYRATSLRLMQPPDGGRQPPSQPSSFSSRDKGGAQHAPLSPRSFYNAAMAGTPSVLTDLTNRAAAGDHVFDARLGAF